MTSHHKTEGSDNLYIGNRKISHEFRTRFSGINDITNELSITFTSFLGGRFHRHSVLSNRTIVNKGMLEHFLEYEWAIMTLYEGLKEFQQCIQDDKSVYKSIELFEGTELVIYVGVGPVQATIRNTNCDDTHTFPIDDFKPFTIGGSDSMIENGHHLTTADLTNVIDTLYGSLSAFRKHKGACIDKLMCLPYKEIPRALHAPE